MLYPNIVKGGTAQYFGYSEVDSFFISGSSRGGWYGVGYYSRRVTPHFRTLRELSVYLHALKRPHNVHWGYSMMDDFGNLFYLQARNYGGF